jgi:Kef-type K+ transport system membrane component KefB
MSQIDPASFLVIVAVAGAAGLISTALARRVVILVVVIELVLGAVIGPQVGRLVDNELHHVLR